MVKWWNLTQMVDLKMYEEEQQRWCCSDPPPRPPKLFPFFNRLGHNGNRPEILKYSVSVPNEPGRNYRGSFTIPDFLHSHGVSRQLTPLGDEDYARRTH
jgi:hypothetical protein